MAQLFAGNPWPFLILTLAFGGGGAWMIGRSVALAWGPIWQVIGYAVPFAFGIRFLHYALGGGGLLAPVELALDYAICLAIALAGHRFTLTSQMTSQYPWLYERTGPFSWRDRAG